MGETRRDLLESMNGKKEIIIQKSVSGSENSMCKGPEAGERQLSGFQELKRGEKDMDKIGKGRRE